MDIIPEILAPVGSEEALIAAVRSGADAVYFGTSNFNARRYAKSFDDNDLIKAVGYCHARNVKTYITVNTLIRDEELQAAAKCLESIAESGADGIIVQDLAVVSLAKNISPGLKLHASTQMAVHNLDGVLQLEEVGFSRVVLARELSLHEISSICMRCGTEIEVFVHGALCASFSGMCYFSASLGERSGNRGTCAQPCRLPFKCRGEEYCLSLKDMSHLKYLNKLSECGVRSFKIEGRMKRPEYVAAAVNAARLARDGMPYSEEDLQSVFSRNGFTDGYLTARVDQAMFGTRSDKDAEKTKNSLSSFRNLYRNERQSVPVKGSFVAKKGEPVSFSVSDDLHSVTVSGVYPEAVKNTETKDDALKKSICQTGGTPFYFNEILIDMDKGLTVPLSSVKAIRREALEKLLIMRESVDARMIHPAIIDKKDRNVQSIEKEPLLRVHFSSADQVFRDERINTYILPVHELIQHPELIDSKVWCELPDVTFPDEEEQLDEKLDILKARGLTDAVAGNLGSVRRALRKNLKVHGGYGLNITNRISAEEYRKLGLADITVSFELSFPKIRDLFTVIPLGCIIAGRLPLMQMRNCPARKSGGCRNCDGHPTVTDHTGRKFPVICHEKRYVTLLNSVPYYTADKTLPNVDFYTVFLTTETREEGMQLVGSAAERRKTSMERTTGMSFRLLL